ncbi:hypothetical protein D3C78_1751700 [compost metagenome]
MACLVFLSIEDAYVLLTTIEVKSANRLAVVVIKQNTEVALSIAMNDSLGIHNRPDDCLDDMEAFQLIKCRLDSIFASFINRLTFRNRQDSSHCI